MVVIDIADGTTITMEMLTFKRPGSGISPSDIDLVVGKTAMRNIKQDELVKKDM